MEHVLSKSKSQGAFDDNDISLLVPKKKVTVRRSHTENEMPQSIADLRARLKESGESEWRKRVPLSNNATDELKLLKEKNRYNVSNFKQNQELANSPKRTQLNNNNLTLILQPVNILTVLRGSHCIRFLFHSRNCSRRFRTYTFLLPSQLNFQNYPN